MERMLGTADLTLLEKVFEALKDCPFFVKDSQLRYAACNAAMTTLCGVSSSAALYGESAASFFPQSLAEHYETLDRLVLESALPIQDRLEKTIDQKGREIWLLFSRTPIFDHSGQCAGVIATARKFDSSKPVSGPYPRLAKVVSHLTDHFHEPLNLKALAMIAHTSASQLERDFKSVFAITLRDFQHRKRMQHASALLQTNEKIADVALACGYSDQSAFARRFRALVGATPSAYRKRFLNKPVQR